MVVPGLRVNACVTCTALWPSAQPATTVRGPLAGAVITSIQRDRETRRSQLEGVMKRVTEGEEGRRRGGGKGGQGGEAVPALFPAIRVPPHPPSPLKLAPDTCSITSESGLLTPIHSREARGQRSAEGDEGPGSRHKRRGG